MFEDMIPERTEESQLFVGVCDQCTSTDIEVYPIADAYVLFYYMHCKSCGSRWTAIDV